MFSLTFIVAFLVSSALQQDTVGLPQCCYNIGLGSFPWDECSLSDRQCICLSSLTSNLTALLQEACNAADTQAGVAWGQRYCSEVGIDIFPSAPPNIMSTSAPMTFVTAGLTSTAGLSTITNSQENVPTVYSKSSEKSSTPLTSAVARNTSTPTGVSSGISSSVEAPAAARTANAGHGGLSQMPLLTLMSGALAIFLNAWLD